MNNTIEDIRTALETKILDTLLILEKKYPEITFPIPTLILRQIGKSAGYAIYADNTVTINTDFCQNGHWDEMLNNTLPHEVAHLAARLIWKTKYPHYEYTAHGSIWKMVMHSIGLEAKRCHSMSLEGVKTKRKVEKNYVYSCGCPTPHNLSRIKHNRFMLGQYNNLHCKRCKVSLKYVGEKI